MFQPYKLRPDTTQAIRVTRDNYRQVADWLAANVADDKGVRVVHPGDQNTGQPRDGLGRARITFRAAHAAPWTAQRSVAIPGVLTVASTPDGPVYTGHSVDMFDAQWEPASE